MELQLECSSNVFKVQISYFKLSLKTYKDNTKTSTVCISLINYALVSTLQIKKKMFRKAIRAQNCMTRPPVPQNQCMRVSIQRNRLLSPNVLTTKQKGPN